ncbi:MAG: hypothetical protein IH840_10195, partial [Candidatus Heimdallarchaeota archaeon]|nr:hypothetical protein [Candidatus Heimdallarchaeota archaeon]
SEGRFKITKDSIELIAMDPANVAMVIFKLLSSAFVEYKVDKDVELTINLSNLKSILRRTKPSDMVTLELEENRLKIQIKGTSTRSFLLPLIDIEEKQQKIPELNFPVNIKTTSEVLNDAIEDVDVVGESVMFEVNITTDRRRFQLSFAIVCKQCTKRTSDLHLDAEIAHLLLDKSWMRAHQVYLEDRVSSFSGKNKRSS